MILAGALWLSGTSPDVYRTVWLSFRSLGVAAVFAACLRLSQAHRLGFWSAETRQKIFLLAAVVAVTGLVQFPQAASDLFLLLRSSRRAPDLRARRERAKAAVARARRDARLLPALCAALDQSRLRLRSRSTVRTVRSACRSRPSSGRRNPGHREGRRRLRLVDPVRSGEERRKADLRRSRVANRSISCPAFRMPCPTAPALPATRWSGSEEVYRGLEEKGSRAVVLNRIPQPTGNLRPRVVARFEELFPHSRAIGQFAVRWKD